VLVEANNDKGLLLPGMTATIDFVVNRVESALLIPNAALRFVPPQTKTDERDLLQKLVPFGPRKTQRQSETGSTDERRSVYRLVDGQPEQLMVTVGASDGQRTQVLSGDVVAGAAVIVDVKSGKE
jgi:HlyD family secretion protein